MKKVLVKAGGYVHLGSLYKEDGVVNCSNEHEELHNCTHYILISDIKEAEIKVRAGELSVIETK